MRGRLKQKLQGLDGYVGRLTLTYIIRWRVPAKHLPRRSCLVPLTCIEFCRPPHDVLGTSRNPHGRRLSRVFFWEWKNVHLDGRSLLVTGSSGNGYGSTRDDYCAAMPEAQVGMS